MTGCELGGRVELRGNRLAGTREHTGRPLHGPSGDLHRLAHGAGVPVGLTSWSLLRSRSSFTFWTRETQWRTVTGIPSFVETMGGAYCFVPTMGAIRWIASQDRR